MKWLVEPLAGVKMMADRLAADNCSGDSVLNHCKWPLGLKRCDCSGGLVVEI